MKIRIAFILFVFVFLMSGAPACGTADAYSYQNETEVNDTKTMLMKIGDKSVDVAWEENASVEELKGLAASGLTISMSMYGGFEQVGPVGKNITRDDKQTTTTAGDIVLYSGNQLVVFYGSNSWAYTRLGRINLPENELKELLSNGDVTITLSVE
ncbi:cyclophilin-like fold protein [Butyrivibrio proteoclasticus]|uniref:cyclophilin-like fold protein n=1 Tax=Butyrivibrio proteoclasticus TaxID=43305 RepID=UPI000B100AE2|nr:cyclophilin-like fold protein [Butyrivibrio proteoclasticus]